MMYDELPSLSKNETKKKDTQELGRDHTESKTHRGQSTLV